MRTKFQVILLCVVGMFAMSANSADIVLIIDDMGNTRRDAEAFSLPSEVTFSILPHTPLSKKFAQRALTQNRDIMLHIPMESLAGNRLGPGALTSSMHPHLLRETLEEAIDSVPNAIGVNNHMGSKLTQLTLPMRTTMDVLFERNLFFVDSKTTRYSKAINIAEQKGVLHVSRHIFLDHFAESKHIDNQFKRLVRIAKKYGTAIGIGHPYPQTVNYLKSSLPLLSDENVRLIPISKVIKIQQIALRAKTEDSPQLTME